MTDSSIETNSGDGAFDAGSSVDELFGEFADESLEGADDESTAESTTEEGGDAGASGVEDQTAADVFGQLRANAEDDADEVLADESPEDIIASADEPDPEPDIDDDLRVEDDELADLLLTGRSKEKEFLWVESGSSPETDEENGSNERESPGAAAGETDTGAIFDSDTASDTETVTDAALENEDTTESEDETELAADEDGDLELEDSDTAEDTTTTEDTATSAEDTDTLESDETALVARDEGDVPATVEDDDGSSGVLGWLRSKLGGLF